MHDENAQAQRTVYISGAITTATPNELQLFHAAATELRGRGFRVINPLDFDFGPQASHDHDAWCTALARDIELIVRECDSITILPNYWRSRGALLEIFIALSLKKRFVLLYGQRPQWAEHVRAYITNAQALLWVSTQHTGYTHHHKVPRPRVHNTKVEFGEGSADAV